jgi:hypothetical protein
MEVPFLMLAPMARLTSTGLPVASVLQLKELEERTLAILAVA